MSDVGSATSMFIAMQAQWRSQTMAINAVKQQASQERAVADMLATAAQAAQSTPAPSGQGLAVDIRV